MTLEGLLEFAAVRDFLYSRMRGYRDARSPARAHTTGDAPIDAEAAALLREAVEELRAIRVALERRHV
jgi:putative membrane protein